MDICVWQCFVDMQVKVKSQIMFNILTQLFHQLIYIYIYIYIYLPPTNYYQIVTSIRLVYLILIILMFTAKLHCLIMRSLYLVIWVDESVMSILSCLMDLVFKKSMSIFCSGLSLCILMNKILWKPKCPLWLLGIPSWEGLKPHHHGSWERRRSDREEASSGMYGSWRQSQSTHWSHHSSQVRQSSYLPPLHSSLYNLPSSLLASSFDVCSVPSNLGPLYLSLLYTFIMLLSYFGYTM